MSAAAHPCGIPLLGPMSHSTVKHHLANARPRVGVETTAQLMSILRSRGTRATSANGGRGVQWYDRRDDERGDRR